MPCHGTAFPGSFGKRSNHFTRNIFTNKSFYNSAEIFPTGIRSICLVFTTCTQWLGQFTIVYSTPYMMTNIKFGTFYLFGSSLVIAGIVVFFFMPETKGLSIEEMDILFAQKGLAHNIRKKTDAIISQNAANDVATMVRGDEKSNKVEMEEL
jgi:hypothetical protein